MGSRVAATLHWPFVDTGTMYRAITWLALRQGIDPADTEALGRLANQITMRVLPPAAGSTEYATVIVEGEDASPYLRSPEVEQAVSLVSAVRQVRRRLVPLQRSLIAHHPAVMAGRDIGTVVVPDARLKVFLDATPETRAERRTVELARVARLRPYVDVLAETIERDRLDSSRDDSPLASAADAVRIDTNGLSENEVVDQIVDLARQVFGGEV